MKTTWKKLILKKMYHKNETWNDLLCHTFMEGEINKEFNDGFGGSEGIAFTLWTQKRVYFPTEYDGAEGVGSVARFPDGIATEHI